MLGEYCKIHGIYKCSCSNTIKIIENEIQGAKQQIRELTIHMNFMQSVKKELESRPLRRCQNCENPIEHLNTPCPNCGHIFGL